MDELQKTNELSFEERKKLRQTLLGFGLLYFRHHLYLAPAKYHTLLVGSLDDEKIDMLEIIGHRGSTKSTWGSLIYPIYMALEHPDIYPFIVPIADTGLQASMNMANIKQELEENALLKQDYGHVTVGRTEDRNPEPTLESDEEWQSKNLLLSTGVRILARSRGQKIRGLKHRQYRPGLVIIDDPEDLEWVHSKENRDKTARWMLGEVFPAMDLRRRKCVLIGNWLHMDALMARMKNKGIFKVLEFPLIDPKTHECQWPALFPTVESLEAKKKELGPVSWQREMLLKAVAEEGQIITEEDIHYYDEEPAQCVWGIKATAIDPAISKKQTADFTAMVSGKAAWLNDLPKIYIQKNPINLRLGVNEQIAHAKAINEQWPGEHMFFVEDVAYQHALIELMEAEMLSVQGIKTTTDKRSKLMVVSTYIKNGVVQFPRTGCEDLIIQLLGFGIEEHDDLVDALVNLINGIIECGIAQPKFIVLGD